MTGRVLLALVLSCTATRAAAQDRFYLTGGFASSWREPAWVMSLATPSQPPAAPVPAAAIGAGLWFQRDVAVEGMMTVHRPQSVPWHYGYQFGGNSDQLTDDRDLLTVGYLRIAPMRGRRVSIEPLVGGGVNWHRGQSVMTAGCGTGSTPAPCVPVTPPTPSDSLTTGEWMASLGADVALRLSTRVALAPGFRLDMVRRRQYLTGFDHRGPASGGGMMPGFTVTLRYQMK
jgi:hypothetical protein